MRQVISLPFAPRQQLLANGDSKLVVADATATHGHTGYDGKHYDPYLVHEVELAALNGEFATVRTAADILEETGVASNS